MEKGRKAFFYPIIGERTQFAKMRPCSKKTGDLAFLSHGCRLMEKEQKILPVNTFCIDPQADRAHPELNLLVLGFFMSGCYFRPRCVDESLVEDTFKETVKLFAVIKK